MVKKMLPFYLRVFWKGGKGVVSLIRQNISIRQKQDTWSACRFVLLLPVRQVPATMKQLPGDLEGDESLAGTGGQCQQDALLIVGNGRKHPFDGYVLIVAALKVAAPILERHSGEAVTPGVLNGKGPAPQFIRGRISGQFTLDTGGHVDAIDALTVGGVGKANRQLQSIVLGLPYSFGRRLVPGLGLHHRQFSVAILQHIISSQRLAPLAVPLDHAGCDCLQPHPSRRLSRRGQYVRLWFQLRSLLTVLLWHFLSWRLSHCLYGSFKVFVHQTDICVRQCFEPAIFQLGFGLCHFVRDAPA